MDVSCSCLQVLNEANLTNAILVRSVLTRSDLGGAVIEGADFSDAVIDLLQKQVILESSSSPTNLEIEIRHINYNFFVL